MVKLLSIEIVIFILSFRS